MTGLPDNSSQLLWRTIEASDKQALDELDAACKAADGEEPVSRLTVDALSAAERDHDNTLCVALDSQLVAAAWVQPYKTGKSPLAYSLGGRVRPEFRRRGIGESLLIWAETRTFKITRRSGQIQFRIANEALTEDARQLYLDYGYQMVFSEWMLVRPLQDDAPPPVPVGGFTLHSWDEENAGLFFQAYREGFRDRLGDIIPAEADWIDGYAGDKQFRPDLSRLVMKNGQPAAFVTCCVDGKTGWISQIAVLPQYRRRGLAQELLLGALVQFRDAGCCEAALHVNSYNPAAQSLFFDSGFAQRLTRARFLKEVTAEAL